MLPGMLHSARSRDGRTSRIVRGLPYPASREAFPYRRWEAPPVGARILIFTHRDNVVIASPAGQGRSILRRDTCSKSERWRALLRLGIPSLAVCGFRPHKELRAFPMAAEGPGPGSCIWNRKKAGARRKHGIRGMGSEVQRQGR